MPESAAKKTALQKEPKEDKGVSPAKRRMLRQLSIARSLGKRSK